MLTRLLRHPSSLHLSGLVLVVAFAVSTAHAQTVAFEYDASTGVLPSASGWTHFVEDPAPDDGLDESNFSVAAGVLTLGDSGGPNADDANRQYYVGPSYDFYPARDLVEVEFRLRLTTSTWRPPPDANPKGGFAIDVADQDGERFLLYIGSGGLFIWAGSAQSLHLFDATAAMTDYVLRIDESGVSISVDGTIVGFVPRSTFGFSTPPQIRFGDVADSARGGFELEHIRVLRSDPETSEVRFYEMVTSLSPAQGSTDTVVETATCPAGKTAFGGGALVEGGVNGVMLTESRLTGGTPPTAWTASARPRSTTGAGWQLRAYVLCGELPNLQVRSVLESHGLAGGSAIAACSVGQSPVSGGALVGVLLGDVDPGLTGIGLDLIGQSSDAEAYDLAYGGIPETTDWDLVSSVACIDAGDAVVVSSRTPSTSYDALTPKTRSVQCPGELEVVGGGARVIGPSSSVVLAGSHPDPATRSWVAVGHDLGPSEGGQDFGLEVVAVCVPRADPMIPRFGLVSRWRADAGDGRDDLGRNDALLVNGASVEPGLDDQAFSLERASEEHLRVPGDDFYPDGSFSADAWIQTSSLVPGESAYVMSLLDAGGPSGTTFNDSYWALHLNADGEARARVRAAESTTSATVVGGAVNLADGHPHHLAMVKDIENGSVLRLFVDGDLVDELGLGQALLPLYPGSATPDPLTIGVRRVYLSTDLINEFEGLIDDAKYWDRALTADEIERMAGCNVTIVPRVLNLEAKRFGGPAGAPTNTNSACSSTPEPTRSSW